MEEQDKFVEILGEIKDIAALQENSLSKDEIQKYLSDMDLNEDKMNAVCSYLVAGGIKIDGYSKASGSAAGKSGSGRGSNIKHAMQVSGSRETDSQETERALFNRKLYMQEVNNLGKSGASEVNNIIKGFLMGDTALRDKLAENKLNHVIKLASGYKKREAVVNKTVSIDEIIAEGNVGLLVGISVIEENRERYFKEDGTPDYEAVHGTINMEILSAMESFIDMESEDKDWENTVIAKINLLHEAAKYLTEESGSIPTKEELSEYTKIPVGEIDSIMNISEDTKRVASS